MTIDIKHYTGRAGSFSINDPMCCKKQRKVDSNIDKPDGSLPDFCVCARYCYCPEHGYSHYGSHD